LSLAIQTRDLTKWFPLPGRLGLPFARRKGTLAVDRVSIEVEEGEIFGLVGPNGAGKTTLVKMLATLILPTSGTARVNGYDLSQEDRIKATIGLVTGDERSFYWRLSCRENLRFYAGLYNLSPSQTERRINELSRLLGLDDFLDKRFDTCSTGMKHRLALARGLLNDPALLFLDEPTKSLDPLAAARFREALHSLARREGRTIFMVTHDVDEAVELCDRLGVMFRGRLRVVDTPERLRRLVKPREKCYVDVRGFTPRLTDRLLRLEGVHDLIKQEVASGVTRLELRLQERRRCLPALVRAIEESGGTVERLEFEKTSWEEVFARLEEEEATARACTSGAYALRTKEAPRIGEGHGRRWLAILRALYKPLLFLRRDFLIQVSYRFAFVLQLLGILFSTAIFYFIAQLLGTGAAPYLSDYGGDYFSFVLIGIALMGYQGVALYTFSQLIRSGQVTGTLEAMLVTPTRPSTILLSSSLWNFAFSSLQVAVYLLMGVVIFGADLRGANVLAALLILGLTVLAVSAIGILSACFIVVFKRGDPINFLLGALSTFLGGVYYPVGVLPSWLQALARLIPLTYSLRAMRRALLMGASLGALTSELVALASFALVLSPISLLAFRYAVRRAKEDGSLAQF